MPQSQVVEVRFYGELKVFLGPQERGRCFRYGVKGSPSVKDTLEAIGVPHVAIDVIRVNGDFCDFSRQLKQGDKIRVYPVNYFPKAKRVLHLQTRPPQLKFVADSHLGKLARHLRILGFDTLYKNVFPDSEIVHLGVRQRRIVLTRDIGLLKRRRLRFGYWVRSPDPRRQAREIIQRFQLGRHMQPFKLCVDCNGLITPVAKAKVIDQLPEKVQKFYRRFYHCRSCRKVYWRGSHFSKLSELVQRLRAS